jgi:hypothetical protein
MNIYSEKTSNFYNAIHLLKTGLSDDSSLCITLTVLEKHLIEHPQKGHHYLEAMIHLVKQVPHLRQTHDYHGTPAPWIQIKLYHILGLILKSTSVEKASLESLYTCLLERYQETCNEVDAAFGTSVIYETFYYTNLLLIAVLYELICLLCQIYSFPTGNADMRDQICKCFEAIVRFTHSTNSNLRYFGLSMLEVLVTTDKVLILPFQMDIINIIEDDVDFILHRKVYKY